MQAAVPDPVRVAVHCTRPNHTPWPDRAAQDVLDAETRPDVIMPATGRKGRARRRNGSSHPPHAEEDRRLNPRTSRWRSRIPSRASHSLDGPGVVHSDFAGMARIQRTAVSGVPRLYFTGCAGSVPAAKYNENLSHSTPRTRGYTEPSRVTRPNETTSCVLSHLPALHDMWHRAVYSNQIAGCQGNPSTSRPRTTG